jgi:hypothetical protein
MTKSTDMSWAGIGLRFIIAIIIVYATYNPSGYSFLDWALNTASGNNVFKAFIGILLLIGWAVYIRATRRSLGMIGVVLATSFFSILLWLLIDLQIIPANSVNAVVYIVLLVIGCLLATGMCWSHIRRRISGQIDVDDTDS